MWTIAAAPGREAEEAAVYVTEGIRGGTQNQSPCKS